MEVHSEEGAFLFSIMKLKEVPTGVIWLNKKQRKWAGLSPGQVVNIRPFTDQKQPLIITIIVEAHFYKKKYVYSSIIFIFSF